MEDDVRIGWRSSSPSFPHSLAAQAHSGTLPTPPEMSTTPSSAVQASTKLLRVVSALIAQVDPIKGGRASVMQGLAEEVSEVLVEIGGHLPEVRDPFFLHQTPPSR